jgi:hypothetical protein
MKLLAPLCIALAALVSTGAAAAAKDHHKHAAAKTKPKAGKAHKAAPPVRKAALARPAIDYDGEQVNFSEWQAVREFEDEMVARHGFAREDMDALIRQVRYVESAVTLMKPAPPGKPKNWHAYRERFVEPIRINAGLRFWDENAGRPRARGKPVRRAGRDPGRPARDRDPVWPRHRALPRARCAGHARIRLSRNAEPRRSHGVLPRRTRKHAAAGA